MMAKTTADVLVERLTGLGRGGRLRPARRRHQWLHGRHAQDNASGSASCRCATRRGRRSWPAGTQSLPAGSASASPRAAPAPSTCSTVSTTPRWTATPVLAITGQTYHDLMGMHYQQEVNLLGLFEDVAVFNQQINGPKHAHWPGRCRLSGRPVVAGRGTPHLPQRLAGTDR